MTDLHDAFEAQNLLPAKPVGHTPGPHAVHGPYKNGDESYFEVVSPELTCLMTVSTEGTNLAEAEANARLFAAAPDLLAALKDLIDTPADQRQAKHWAAAERAIAKAEESR